MNLFKQVGLANIDYDLFLVLYSSMYVGKVKVHETAYHIGWPLWLSPPNVREVQFKHLKTRRSQKEILILISSELAIKQFEQDHLRMNVAPDQTIILGL